MRILRWEIDHKGTTCGPYWAASEWNALNETSPHEEVRRAADHLHGMFTRHQNTANHPSAPDEGLDICKPVQYFDELMSNGWVISHTPDWIFGFDTEAKMNRWFTPRDQEALRLCGFRLSWYEVDPKYVQKGRKQVMFVRSKAKLV